MRVFLAKYVNIGESIEVGAGGYFMSILHVPRKLRTLCIVHGAIMRLDYFHYFYFFGKLRFFGHLRDSGESHQLRNTQGYL